jgi:hypothetical protein
VPLPGSPGPHLTPIEDAATLPLNRDPLDLIDRDLIAGEVVELRGARAVVHHHCLGVLQRAARFQVSRDCDGQKRMAADPALETRIGRAPLDDAVGIDPAQAVCSERLSGN